jgi:16S rRNA (cytosine1402-N4)-methyltransferase
MVARFGVRFSGEPILPLEVNLHVPVLLREVLEALSPKSGGIYFDGTLGGGGYAEAILEATSPDGRLVGVDLDQEAVARSAKRLERFGERFTPVHDGFHHAQTILRELGIAALDGAVLDLGLSSYQLEDAERGFSFQGTGPLDMRFDNTAGQSALEYLRKISVKQLEEILATYGEERYSKKLARSLIVARDRGELATTQDLARTVSRILGGRREKIHPATRTFQALRIAVNAELENLATALEQIPLLMNEGARFCVVSYHSLEHRAVKHSFQKKKPDVQNWRILTPKPIKPSFEESRLNRRSRSAQMRVIEALSNMTAELE